MLRVSQRTMAALGVVLDVAENSDPLDTQAQLVARAKAYAAFAAADCDLLRAFFDFRMAPDAKLPDWSASDQLRLFARLEQQLAALMPGYGAEVVKRQARTLFSTVDGIAALGLEQKLAEMPAQMVDAELERFIDIFVAGLKKRTPTA